MNADLFHCERDSYRCWIDWHHLQRVFHIHESRMDVCDRVVPYGRRRCGMGLWVLDAAFQFLRDSAIVSASSTIAVAAFDLSVPLLDV